MAIVKEPKEKNYRWNIVKGLNVYFAVLIDDIDKVFLFPGGDSSYPAIYWEGDGLDRPQYKVFNTYQDAGNFVGRENDILNFGLQKLTIKE